jgi:hypothetical protein
MQLGRIRKGAYDAQIEENPHERQLLVESRKPCVKYDRNVRFSIQNYFMS